MRFCDTSCTFQGLHRQPTIYLHVFCFPSVYTFYPGKRQAFSTLKMNEAFDVMQMLALGQTRTILKVVHLENKRFKCIYQFYFAMRKHTFTMAVRRG